MRAQKLGFALVVPVFLDADGGVGAQHATPVAVAVGAAGAGLRGRGAVGDSQALAAGAAVDCSAAGAESAEVFVWPLGYLLTMRGFGI